MDGFWEGAAAFDVGAGSGVAAAFTGGAGVVVVVVVVGAADAGVTAGTVVPFYNQPGGGTQYYTPTSHVSLIEGGFA